MYYKSNEGNIIFDCNVIYLIKLNALNKELLSYNFSSAFTLLIYKNYEPLKFFGIASGLFLIGCILFNRGIHRIRWELESFEELVVSCLTTLAIIILLILLIVFIDNPILRAVFVSCLVIFGVVSAGK